MCREETTSISLQPKQHTHSVAAHGKVLERRKRCLSYKGALAPKQTDVSHDRNNGQVMAVKKKKKVKDGINKYAPASEYAHFPVV